MRRREGFTLIELLVATAVLAIAVVYLTRTFTVQQRTYQVVDQVAEAQQNLRAISALMEHDVRQAGFMVWDGAAVCGVDNTTAPDVLYVSDADAVDPEGFLFAELGAKVSTGTYAGSTGLDALTVSGALNESLILDGDPFYDYDADGVADYDFRADGGAILTDVANPVRGRACGVVTTITSTTAISVTFANTLAAYDAASHATPDLRLVPAHRYSIGGASGVDLLRDGQVLTTDVEDLQVAFYYDRDDDGVAETSNDEWAGMGGGEPNYAPGNGAFANGWPPARLREVRINFVTRSRSTDPNVRYQDGAFQTTENRAAVAGNDGFRRRVHTSTIRLRNIGTRDLPV